MPLQARRSALVAVRLARWATFQTTLPALKKGRRQALRRNAPALRLEQPACAPADPPSPLGLIPGGGPGRGPARAPHAEPEERFADAKRCRCSPAGGDAVAGLAEFGWTASTWLAWAGFAGGFRLVEFLCHRRGRSVHTVEATLALRLMRHKGVLTRFLRCAADCGLRAENPCGAVAAGCTGRTARPAAAEGG